MWKLPFTFGRHTQGSVITIFALVAPPLALIVCGGVEMAEVLRTKTHLQSIVDGAALAGAQQFLVDRSQATRERSRLSANTQAVQAAPKWAVSTQAQADASTGAFTVGQDAIRQSFFGNLLPPGGFHIKVSATAIALSSQPLCVLGIASSGADVVGLDKNAVMSAPSCLVQSNAGVEVKDGARMSAAAIRSVGGAAGAISPAPITDAPSVADPFASLSISMPKSCKGEKLTLDSGTTMLNPGLHCDQLKLTGYARLVLNPGDHYFLNGSFDVQDDAQIVGDNVVIIFKNQYKMKFADRAALSLAGRTAGPYAGFVLITDRSFKGQFSIASDRARRLLGTIYVPNGTFDISGSNNRVADQSPWTIVVANKLKVSDSANLVINSDYYVSSVPVPSGVGPGKVRLSQ